MTGLLLAAAISCEVAATLALRVHAAQGRRSWLVAIVAGYAGSFALLGLVLGRGMAVGVAYGIWCAVGIAATAVAGHVLFGDPLTRRMLAGIALTMVGVLLVEIGAGG